MTRMDGPPTEARNPRTVAIDELPTLDVLRLLSAEDATVPAAVAAALPRLADAVDLVTAALAADRRLHYFGAGTSGRLAVLDAAEVRPTFGLAADRVVAHLAGGERAMTHSSESAEDDVAAGAAAAAELSDGDVAVGVTASGRTPYVGGALRAGRERGARTVLVSADPRAALAPLADVHVAVDTGPEAITGSTRLKAGTAAKLVLNSLSTAVMIRLGRTYSNLMIDMVASNDKLRGRQVRMLAQATGADPDACREALTAAAGDPKVALVTLLSPAGPEDARRALADARGMVRNALRALAPPAPGPAGDPYQR
ncbi:N-acetylmuramic acid 6-phosphate etherase [Planosporangium thailandense]|uniref:N-acetylmuramic acid 6-phosphate etherase n=1 Tax=Planosporangium thailandense TaxID=765197 RepID=A0ABX0Y3H2_9ACTN|nr:N-acetylmuramic acid 6-phosphate etherase [Planosporangium thailandense]NJC72682.1 N-acetylmuramic acid 6-phosphate etherase [Planosporangium thailandense]